jgi:hypothetical protein
MVEIDSMKDGVSRMKVVVGGVPEVPAGSIGERMNELRRCRSFVACHAMRRCGRVDRRFDETNHTEGGDAERVKSDVPTILAE